MTFFSLPGSHPYFPSLEGAELWPNSATNNGTKSRKLMSSAPPPPPPVLIIRIPFERPHDGGLNDPAAVSPHWLSKVKVLKLGRGTLRFR